MSSRDSFKLAWAIYKRKRVIRDYFASYPIRKLEIGAGPIMHEGWLCTDNRPDASSMYMDVRESFPFQDNSFHYVYSEHMIEHITWNEGLFMVKECYRVMEPNGMIRIATPNLTNILRLYNNSDDPIAEKYIRWVTDRYLGIDVYKASIVINNAFRNWHHQFLYDGDLLEMTLNKSGFTNVQRCLIGESSNENLRGMEANGKKVGNEEMVAFETIVYEGTCYKPNM